MSDDVRALYRYSPSDPAAPQVLPSDACRLRLSHRSWCPGEDAEDVVVDLALGADSAPSTLPLGVVDSAPSLRVGERVRLSLAPGRSKTCKGGVPTPCGIDFENLEAWKQDRQEVTVEILGASDEHALGGGLTLLRRSTHSATSVAGAAGCIENHGGLACKPLCGSRFVVQYEILSLCGQDPRDVFTGEACSSTDAYQHWTAQRHERGNDALKSCERLEFRYGLRDRQVPIGIEEALLFVHDGQQTCEVLLEPPSDGFKALLIFKIMEADLPVHHMGRTDRVDTARLRKDEGSTYLSNECLDLAESLYRASVDLVNDDAFFDDSPPELQVSRRHVKLASLLNLALVCIKAKKWMGSAEAASGALALDPRNVKALYRRGLAYARQGRHAEAEADLAAAAELAPEDGNIVRELAAARAGIKGGSKTRRIPDAATPALAESFVSCQGLFSEGRQANIPTTRSPSSTAAEAETQRLKTTCHMMLQQMKESLTNEDGEEVELPRDPQTHSGAKPHEVAA